MTKIKLCTKCKNEMPFCSDACYNRYMARRRYDIKKRSQETTIKKLPDREFNKKHYIGRHISFHGNYYGEVINAREDGEDHVILTVIVNGTNTKK